MSDDFLRPSWCEIDLSAVAHNIRQLKSIIAADVRLYVCLKGNGSGCGAIAVAERAEASGADGLAFGNIDSAVSCRVSGVKLPILLYPSCLPDTAPILEAHNLIPTISTVEEVACWSRSVQSLLPVFLKIDGGGFRAGAFPHHAATVAKAIANDSRLRLAGVYGHPMTSYGIEDPTYTRSQIDSFLHAISEIEAAGIDIPVRMISSSSIFLNHPDADLNGIDPGRLVMGMGFPALPERQRDWRPALTALKSRLVLKKSVDDIGEVMTAPFFERRPGMSIGLIPLGWSDGYPSKLPRGATALVHGRRVPLLGPVHSELMRIDLTEMPDAQVGDEVVLLGRSGDDEITMADLCEQWKGSEIEIYSAIGRSLPKVYLS